MKGTIVPKARFEPTSLASRTSVLTITPPGLADVTNVLLPHLSMPKRSVPDYYTHPLGMG